MASVGFLWSHRDSQATPLLLARTVNPQQRSRIGNPTAGPVFLFLHTDDFWTHYHDFEARRRAFYQRNGGMKFIFGAHFCFPAAADRNVRAPGLFHSSWHLACLHHTVRPSGLDTRLWAGCGLREIQPARPPPGKITSSVSHPTKRLLLPLSISP